MALVRWRCGSGDGPVNFFFFFSGSLQARADGAVTGRV